MITPHPTKEQAEQFAILLQAGLPILDAVHYFYEPEPDEVPPSDAFWRLMANQWQNSRAVRSAQLALMGSPWQALSLDERLHLAIDKHYSEMAYFLFNNNYCDLMGADKSKADTARNAIETKIAGLAGKGSALDRFLDDLKAGKIKSLVPAVEIPLSSLGRVGHES